MYATLFDVGRWGSTGDSAPLIRGLVDSTGYGAPPTGAQGGVTEDSTPLAANLGGGIRDGVPLASGWDVIQGCDSWDDDFRASGQGGDTVLFAVSFTVWMWRWKHLTLMLWLFNQIDTLYNPSCDTRKSRCTDSTTTTYGQFASVSTLFCHGLLAKVT